MGYGFIRSEQQIKSLILFGMSLMPVAVTETDLLSVISVDEGFTYLDFAPAFQDLVQNGLVSALPGGRENRYILTAEGAGLVSVLKGDLPASVRDRAEAAAIQTMRRIARESDILTEHSENGDGSYQVRLRILDKDRVALGLELRVGSLRQCTLLENHFRKNAETLFAGVTDLLLQGLTDSEKP